MHVRSFVLNPAEKGDNSETTSFYFDKCQLALFFRHVYCKIMRTMNHDPYQYQISYEFSSEYFLNKSIFIHFDKHSLCFVCVCVWSADGNQLIQVDKAKLNSVVPNSLPETFVNVRGKIISYFLARLTLPMTSFVFIIFLCVFR